MASRDLRNRADLALERWGHFVVRHRVAVLGCSLLFAAFFAAHAPSIEVDTSVEGFMLDDDPVLLAYNDFRNRFERDDQAILAIRSDEIFDLGFLARLRALHDDLEENVLHLSEVDSLLNARSTRGVEGGLIVDDLFEDWPASEAELAEIRERAHANPIYRNLLLSEDGHYTALAITLDTYSTADDEFDAAAFDDAAPAPGAAAPDRRFLTGEETIEAVMSLREVVARHEAPGFEIVLTGAPVLTQRLTTDMSSDMRRFLGLSILASAAFLFLLFRRVSGTLMPIAVVLLSLASTIGIAPFLDIPLQVPTQILPAFLLAVGIGDSVHVLSMFYQYYEAGDAREEAIAKSLRHSGFAVVMTSLTTAGALASFASATLAPIRNLGILAPIGVLIALGLTLTLLPALLSVVPVGPRPRGGGRLRLVDDALRSCGDLATQRPRTIVAVCAVLLVIGALGATNLRFSHNPVTWFPADDPLPHAMDVLGEHLGGPVALEVLFETDRENALHEPEMLTTLYRLEQANAELDFNGVTIGKSLSIVDILLEIHQALNGGDPGMRVVPDDRRLVAQELLLFENSGGDDLEDVTDPMFETARMTLRAPWVDAIRYAPMIRHIEAEYSAAMGPSVRVSTTGILPLLSRTFESVIQSLSRSYVIAIVVITPLMMLLLMSVRLGLMSMIPNLLPIVLTLGLMGFAGLPLDGFTLLIGSIALGLAVDDTIHFMHSYRRYFDETRDPELAVRRTLHTAGQAMCITTLVLASSFFIFTAGYMRSTFNFGLLTGTALVLAFLADVLLAPALMVLVSRRRLRTGRA